MPGQMPHSGASVVGAKGVGGAVQNPMSRYERFKEMAKSLSEEMAAIEAEERKLAVRRKAHLARLREAGIASIEKAGLLKLPLDRLEGLMKAVKTLGVEETERRLQAKV